MSRKGNGAVFLALASRAKGGWKRGCQDRRAAYSRIDQPSWVLSPALFSCERSEALTHLQREDHALHGEFLIARVASCMEKEHVRLERLLEC